MEYIDIIVNKIRDIKDKEDMRKLVSDLYNDENINDYDFSDLIYDEVIPRLEELGCILEHTELNNNTNYENVLCGNY